MSASKSALKTCADWGYANMSDIRLAVVGIGAMGERHALSVAKGQVCGMNLAAVVAPSEAKRVWAKEQLPGIATYADMESLCASGTVDAVLLASPHSLHAPQAALAIQHGLHVLTEKPIGTRASEILPIAAEAKAQGLIYCVMFNQRVDPVNQRIHQVLHSGQLGRLRRVIMMMTNCYRPQSYFDAGSWRATWAMEGGGMLVNQCSHRLDLLAWWLGMPERVCVHCGYGKWHDIEVDDDISAYFAFPGGGTGHLIASTGDCPGTSLLEFQGDNGKLSLENGRLLWDALEIPEPEFSQTYTGGFGEPAHTRHDITPAAENPEHLGILQNFADAIHGIAQPVVPIEEGLRSLRVTQAMYLSSWTNREVALPADDAEFDALLAQRIALSKPRVRKEVKLDLGALWSQKR